MTSDDFETAWTVAKFASVMDLDRTLLNLLIEDDCIPVIRNGRTVRISRDLRLTERELIAKGRAAYEESLEAAGKILMKMQSVLARASADIQESLENINPVREPGTTLTSLGFPRGERKWPMDQLRSDLSWAQSRAESYQRALWYLDTQARLISGNDLRSKKYL